MYQLSSIDTAYLFFSGSIYEHKWNFADSDFLEYLTARGIRDIKWSPYKESLVHSCLRSQRLMKFVPFSLKQAAHT